MATIILVWAIGQEQIPNFVCLGFRGKWFHKVIAFLNCLYPHVESTAKNQMKPGTVLFSSAEINRELNCSLGRYSPVGIVGGMKLRNLEPRLTVACGDFLFATYSPMQPVLQLHRAEWWTSSFCSFATTNRRSCFFVKRYT